MEEQIEVTYVPVVVEEGDEANILLGRSIDLEAVNSAVV